MSPRNVASTRPFATRFAAVVAAVSFAVPVSAVAAELGPPPHAELSRQKLSAIDVFLNDEIASGKIPGAIVLIQHHGQPVYFKCFGKRDTDKGTPMTADAIFPIHSVTKTITSVAAMMLVDQGKIALDDPVSKYIPSFAGVKVGVERKDASGRPVLDLVPLRRPINIEDLLLHTSGITYGFSRPLMLGFISAISTMPNSSTDWRSCRWPSSRARYGITGIRPTFSAASSRSCPASRSINSRRRICSIRSA